MPQRNPILAREIAHRMRDNRTYFIPVVYTAVLGLVAFGVYLIMAQIDGSLSVQGFRIGESIFRTVSAVQLAIVILLVPSVSASAITSERDNKTLTPLLVTPLSRGAISWAKLVSPLLYVLLLVSTSLPFAALSFGFGGADLADLATSYGCILAAAVYIGTLGLFVSTIMKRTVPAVLLAYGLVAFLIVGTLVGDLVFNVALGTDRTPGIVVSYLNPFVPLILSFADEGDLLRASSTTSAGFAAALQLAVGAVLYGAAHLRIRSMRE